ncbi:MAG: DUF1947 domain-containing protein [Candidatus Bathyarchaeota archaeon]
MGQRYRLKAREIKQILEKVSLTLANIDLDAFSRDMDVAKIGFQTEILLKNGKPVFVCANNEVFPTLLNQEVLEKLPSLTVNMGAIPHLCNGADLMAPGIVKIVGKFEAETIVVVIDEKYSKPIALVKTLYNLQDLSKKKTRQSSHKHSLCG